MNVLSRMNIGAHQGRPFTPENKKLTLWRPSVEFLHCCVESSGCRFNRDSGACVMCDYGIGRNLSPDGLKEALEREVQPYMNSISTLLVGSYGSIFDTEEVSSECFDVILDFVGKSSIKTVIFETHCCTVNEDILKRIRTEIPFGRMNVIIEMGYESCDPYVLRNCLNKILDLGKLCDAIDLVHKYSMEVSLNVFLGAPFLSAEEQLDTAVESVQWAFDRGADSVVIFPCNIKPFTLLYDLYKNNLYKPVSQWMLVELLSRIPEENLNYVTLSWYGNRGNFYENDAFPLIPPSDCDKCHDKIFDFYQAFMQETTSIKRKRLMEEFVKTRMECKCRERFLQDLEVRRERLSKEEIEYLLETIKKN